LFILLFNITFFRLLPIYNKFYKLMNKHTIFQIGSNAKSPKTLGKISFAEFNRNFVYI